MRATLVFTASLCLTMPAAFAAQIPAVSADAQSWQSRADSYFAPAPPPRPEGLSATAAPAADGASRSWLRRLPVADSDLWLRGEYAVRRIPIYMAAWEAARATELRLAAVSAVSILPDSPGLEVLVNGRSVGTIAPRYDAPGLLTVRLMPGQLVPGFNDITLVARQQHRVDCSLAGSYELWTHVLAQSSGIVLAASGSLAPSVADLPSIIGSNASPTVLRVHVPRAVTAADATRLGRFVDAIVLDGWIADPQIVPVFDDRDGPGLDLRIETSNPAAGAASPARRAFADEAALFATERPDGTTEGLTLAAAGGDAADQALDRLEARARSRRPSGSTAGMEALLARFGAVLQDHADRTLRSLGVHTEPFVGRHLVQDIPVRLPGDFYAAGDGRMLLTLDGGYAAGLLPTSQLTVKVNDVDTISKPLDSAGGERFDGLELRLPLSSFHPGLNRLTVKADLVSASDVACEPETAAVRAPRFEIADSSRLVLPVLAHVGQTPNLSAFYSEGLPYARASRPTDLFLVGDQRATLGSALELQAHVSANAQRVLRFATTFRKPAEDEQGVLIGSSNALPAWATAIIGTRGEDGAPRPREKGSPVAGAAPKPGTQVAMADMSVADAARFSPIRAGLPGVAGASGISDGLASIGKTLDAVATWISREPSIKLAWLKGRAEEMRSAMMLALDSPEPARVFRPQDVVLAQRAVDRAPPLESVRNAVVPGPSPATWTVLVADDPERVAAMFEGTSDQAVHFDPTGKYYVYAADRQWSIPAGGDAVLYATRAPWPGNLRLVLAGWLGSNALVYVGLVATAIGLLGAVTFLVARRRRVSA